VADALGMSRVFIHPLAGVLSAYGMGLADQIAMREASVERTLDEAGLAEAAARAAALAQAAADELAEQGFPAAAIERRLRIHVRYLGTDTALVVPLGTLAEVQAAFEVAYRQRFAFLMPGRALLVEAVSAEAVGPGERRDEAAADEAGAAHEPPAVERVHLYAEPDDAEPGWVEAGLWVREQLSPGARVDGPAVIAERNATTVVEPGWQAVVRAGGALELTRVRARTTRHAAGTQADPVLLEVFNNLFMNIAEQMGLRLQNTAYSVNIKERLDFSCALFDEQVQLIANAPHMPVHLGSMSESIRTVIERNPAMQPGDVYVLNDPYHGGTHLPDVTVVTPVFMPAAGADGHAQAPQRALFYVGSRGHHADIGGITPGSMPPFSTRIDEEGVQLDNVKLVEGGRLREREMLDLLSSGPYPSRNPQQNLADLKAQIAANEKGAQELRKM
ncbi:MAG: hydantoinase B/oxoprolinase family protein, partial [Rubrivivax sp.]